MPRVPTNNIPTVRTVQDQNQFQVGRGANPEAFGAGIGRQVTNIGAAGIAAGDEALRIARNNQIIENEREGKELDALYLQRKNELLHGDGTAENPGYYSRQGGAAVDTGVDTTKALEELRKSIGQQATNQAVREAFLNSSATSFAADVKGVNRYVSEQRIVAANTASKARIKEASDDAALAWNDPEIEARSLSIIQNEVVSQGKLNGWDPEVTQSAWEEARTNMYREMVVTSVKNGRIDEAKATLERVKGSMDAPIAAEMQALVDQQENRVEEQVTTDRIIAENPGDPAAQLRAARQLTGELRDNVVKRINRRIDEGKEIERLQKQDIAQEAFGFVNSGGDIDTYAKTNPERFRVLQSDGVLMNRLEKLQDRLAEGREYATASDRVSFTELSEMSDVELSRTDPDTYKGVLTKSEYNKYLTMRRGAIDSLDENSATYEPYRFADSQLARAAPNNLKWGKAKQGSALEKTQNTIRNTVFEQIRSKIELTGKKPTGDEIISMINRAFYATEKPSENTFFRFFGAADDQFAAELQNMTEEQLLQVTVDLENINPAFVQQAREQFKKHGVEATKERLEAFFGAEAIGTVNRALGRRRQREILGLTGRDQPR